MAHDYQAYIRDLVLRLKDEAEDARENRRDEGTGEGFQAGRALAYAEVLSIMQNQADSFLIPRELLALDGFNPVADLARDED
jgi:hypothetical protein